MIRLRPERYAAEKAHKLHPRAAGPFRIRRKINPNAYDIAIPSDWGIPTTFNICDIIPYPGPLTIPIELGLPSNSSEPSLFELGENDGPHVPAMEIMTNDSKMTAIGINTEADAEGITTPESAATAVGAKADESPPGGRAGCPRRSTKPTTLSTDFVYF